MTTIVKLEFPDDRSAHTFVTFVREKGHVDITDGANGVAEYAFVTDVSFYRPLLQPPTAGYGDDPAMGKTGH